VLGIGEKLLDDGMCSVGLSAVVLHGDPVNVSNCGIC
jgi:hypothetical protein